MSYFQSLGMQPPSSGGMLLVREMTHRVANQYMLAVSEASLAAARTSDAVAKSALERVISRLLDSAEVHRVLQPPFDAEQTDLSDYLQMICEALVRSILRERNIKLTIVSDTVALDAERCWRVGLIVTELITNSVKHAFDERGGAIRVEIAADQDLVFCRVSDNGATTPLLMTGRGSEIIEALAQELGGSITQTRSRSGLSVLLTLPLEANFRPITL